MDVQSKWRTGQQVMALDSSSRRWRRARVERPEPMRHRSGGVTDGARILWADLTHDPASERLHGQPSAGGWKFMIVDGWDERAADLDALGHVLGSVGSYVAMMAARARARAA